MSPRRGELWIVHIGDKEAKAASAMLINAGLHGRKYAIGAAVAGMALRQLCLIVMLNSNIGGMSKLRGDRVRPIAVQVPTAPPCERGVSCPGSGQ